MEAKILEGRETILDHARLLEQFAGRCGQSGSMHWLGYFLGGAGARWKRPYVVLLLRPGADAASLKLDDIRGAVLCYEFSAFGVHTGAFATDDWEGLRTVIAEPMLRRQVTALATRALIQRGAHLVLTTYTAPGETRAEPMLEYPNTLWATHDRRVTKQRLVLGPTYEETLAKFGKRTRNHLRYYRRRLLAEMDCEFLPDAGSVLREEDLLRLNAGSRNPLPPSECKRRYYATRDQNGGFLIGLRRVDGELLSIIGGWRQGTTTVMHHQLNAGGYESYSLSTVMRSFFLESEVERGTQTLIFYHGTNHSMSHAFEAEIARDYVVRRKSLRAAAIHRIAGFLVSPRHYPNAAYFGGSGTFFASVLTSDMLEWHPVPLGR